jgi:hypothetical protein
MLKSKKGDISSSITSPTQRRHLRALVSLLTDASQAEYIKGANALLRSARRHADVYFDDYILIIMSNRTYDPSVLELARVAGWRVRSLTPITPPHPSTFERFRDQFIKLHVWNLTDYDEVVYMDSDTLFVKQLGDSFISQNSSCKIWAARDIRAGKWQPGFNMGVAAIRPSSNEFKRLLSLLRNDTVRYEYVMSEQGFLNAVYSKSGWCPLPFEKNANLAVFTQLPLFWHEHKNRIEVIHFTMSKPWSCEQAYKDVCNLWDLGKDEYPGILTPVTVVTAYFHIPNKHGHLKYTQWAPAFFQQRNPLMMFTDAPAVNLGLKARSHPTVVVQTKLASFFINGLGIDFERQLAIDPEKNIHNIPLFQVWLEKSHFVIEAISRNPFNSKYFIWVDVGCFRTGAWGGDWVVHVERLSLERILLLNSPVYVPRKEVGGTIFGGHANAWKRWSRAFYEIASTEAQLGVFIGDDQIVMSKLAQQYPGLVCRVNATEVVGDPWFYLQHYLAGKVPPQAC